MIVEFGATKVDAGLRYSPYAVDYDVKNNRSLSYVEKYSWKYQ